MEVKFISFLLAVFFIIHTEGWKSFKIIQESVKTNITAPDVVQEANIFIRKLNRTYDAMNSSAIFLVDLDQDVVLYVRSYEATGTQWRPSVMNTKLEMCKFFANPGKVSPLLAVFYPMVTSHGNFPTKCPIKADHYVINNFNVNENAFPFPVFPGNRWRYVLHVFWRERLLFETVWNFRVEQNIGRSPKKSNTKPT